MHKVKLTVESLEVDSFDTAHHGGHVSGTVHGYTGDGIPQTACDVNKCMIDNSYGPDCTKEATVRERVTCGCSVIYHTCEDIDCGFNTWYCNSEFC